jgi:hypothetical protein
LAHRQQFEACKSIPVIEQIPVEISPPERQRIATLARKLLIEEPGLSSTEAFGEKVAVGLDAVPSLVLEDHSGIDLFGPADEATYANRALLLAGGDDLVVIGIRRSPAFQAYCRDVLRLGAPEILTPTGHPPHHFLAVRCLHDAELLERVARRARAAGGLNLLPYMGTGGAWALAGAIAARSGVTVWVGAPPPRLTNRANDKIWFAERVAEVLGEQALPPSHPVFSLSTLTRRVIALSKEHASVVVKLPASAASAGNFVFASDELSLSARDVRARLRDAMREAGWRGSFPLLASGWEQPIAASPSVQLWLQGDRAPVVEGIFEQALIGRTAGFTGSAPADLPARWLKRIASEAVRLGWLFQHLGYFGRCSFDAILVGGDPAGWQLHWVECNGRWGGTSIPMTLANRLVGDWRRRPFVVVDTRCAEPGPSVEFGRLLEEIGDDLFVPGVREVGIVLLRPTGRSAGIAFMAFGDTVLAARAKVHKLLPAERLLSPSAAEH